MHLLSAHNLTKYYAGKTLFAGASFSISPGERVGVVGVNGSGKTTLLNLMAGLDVPDAGQITRHPHTRIACLPQNPVMDSRTPVLAYLFQGQAPTMQLLRAYKEAVLALAKDPAHPRRQKIHAAIIQRMDAENGWAAEARAKAILTRLGITQFDSPLGQLSGGERRRVALARALLDPADLLILDEPTNHIDPETIIWLETRLSSLKTALLMVTHDRYFLDRVVSRILEIDRGQIYAIQGNYSAYLEQKTRRETLLQKQTTDRRNVLRRELDWLHRAPMARGGKQKARIKRANALLNAEPAPAPTGLTINLTARRTGKQIIELKHVSKTFGGQPLIKNFSCTINKGARLGIIGPNGVGKTTLLNLIAGRLPPDSGQIITGATVRLGYYDQEGESLDENRRVLDAVTEIANIIQTAGGKQATAAQMLERFRFPRPVQQAYISTLSGGERRRLTLLRTLMTAPNVLLLDEPTNDLDIQTLSILEDYLEGYNGVLIAVSHDRYFLDRTAAHIIAFEGNGIIRQYPGNYSAYRAKKNAPAPPDKPLPLRPKRAAPSGRRDGAKPRVLNYRETQELANLEEKIAALEGDKIKLAAEINCSGDDYRRLQSLSGALARLEAALDRALERWAELAEIAEG